MLEMALTRLKKTLVGLRIIDASTGSILQSASATVNSHSGAFPVHTSTGPFHQLKVALTIAKEALPTSIRFELSVEPEAGDDGEAEISAVSQKMLDFVGEGAQTPVNSWDGHRLIFLRVLSGNVALKAGSATEKSFPKGASSQPWYCPRLTYISVGTSMCSANGLSSPVST